MREQIRKLSPRGEFILVTFLWFAYVTAGSLFALVAGIRRVEFTTIETVASLITELMILGAVAMVLRARGWQPARLGLRFDWKLALAGIPLAMVFTAAYSGLYALAMAFVSSPKKLDFTVVPSAPFALIFLFIVVNSFFEELGVTAYVLEALSEQGAALAITVSVLIRFLYHVYQGPIASLSILPMGILFGLVYWRTRNVWPLIVAHTLLNVLAFAQAAR